MATAEAVRAAYRLWRTESRRDTYVALLIVGVVSAPFVLRYYRDQNQRNNVSA